MRAAKILKHGWPAVLAAGFFVGVGNAQVVIHELHVDPDIRTELVEFIELHNTGAEAVSLAGWSFTDGVSFVFPEGSSIGPGGYVVVGQNPAHVKRKFGIEAFGPWDGRLDNDGEDVRLRDAAGNLVDEVDYGRGFPWPTVGDEPGYSMELIDPQLQNDLGGSWRVSVRGAPGSQKTSLIPERSDWRFLKGRTEPSNPRTAWRSVDFDDGEWETGRMPVGYGDSWVQTELSDMRGEYSSVYFRREFQVANLSQVSSLTLWVQYDDGFRVWINGVEVAGANLAAGEVSFNGTAQTALENEDYVEFVLPNPAGYLRAGRNVIAVQGHNASLQGSSDFWVDVKLEAMEGPVGRGPTPGAQNSVFATVHPPQMRQVKHRPEQPRSGETVTVTVKVTDPDEVGSVELDYQVVAPGAYIALSDPEYESQWTRVKMRDDGLGGDEEAGDDIYTVMLDDEMQQHRHLVRYRITAVDTDGNRVRAPYLDDPQPNFAYFVHDGVPSWRAALRPGSTPAENFAPEEMGRLPVYQLISKEQDVENSTWYDQYRGSDYKWLGTLVYDGEVYDHIRYRARGGVWRYAMGKNMWKFRLNRGHEFQARDNWGRKFRTRWRRVNLGASIQQGNFDHRGEQGMFESVGFRLFNLAGVEAPHTVFVSFRIIDGAEEAHPQDQYEGDFWGVYLAVEQIDGRFLDAHRLPDGNLYKMENGTGVSGADGEIKNQGPTQVDDSSDLLNFKQTYLSSTPSETWWRSHLDLDRYYSYQAIVQAIHHYDICCGKNYYYYYNPETDLWQVHPWDLDLTWADNMYVAGVHGGTEPFQSRVLNRMPFTMEWKNRLRHVRDLLFNDDQAWQLIEEYARLLRGPRESQTVLDADRYQWDYNPIMASGWVNGSKSGQGRFYRFPRESVSRDFSGAVQLMKNYVRYRGGLMDQMAADVLKPAKPTLTPVGSAGFAANDLWFRSSLFSGVTAFQGMEWRLGEISKPGTEGYNPSRPLKYEINAVWETGELNEFVEEMQIPAAAVQVGHRYRARVRMKDDSGRWSHWSDAVEFTAGEPEGSASLVQHLGVSEVMYHAVAGNEFDFIELKNRSATEALELSGVAFTEGIEYVFPEGSTLGPQSYLILAKAADADAFRAEYGLSGDMPIFGPYTGNLSNGGERVTLRTAVGGAEIVSFRYNDNRGWPLAADGAGHSLVPRDGTGGGSLSYGESWRMSGFWGGSPGEADPEPAVGVVLNELEAHTDFSDPEHPEHDSNDWIEIYNAGTEAVRLGGYYLSDSRSELRKWALPDVELGPGMWLSVDEVNDFHQPLTTGFGLTKDGEELLLTYWPEAGGARVVDAVAFGGQENDVTWARQPDGVGRWMFGQWTRDGANVLFERPVKISEVMYHPEGETGTVETSQFEYVELVNRSGADVPLSNEEGGWRLGGAVSFMFGPGETLGASEVVVVVPFDPVVDTVARAAFENRYQLVGVRLAGPYTGRLDNSGERLAVEFPQAPDAEGGEVSWVLMDEVIYSDANPWPESADGEGKALHRAGYTGMGNGPESWRAADPSPGEVEGGGNQDEDLDGDGMPDAWELAHGLDSERDDSLEDADEDGVSNLDEYLSGTRPNDGSDFLQVTEVRLDESGVVVEFWAAAERSYSVLYRDSLTEGAWNKLDDVGEEAEGRAVEVKDGSVDRGEARYYRIVTPANP